MNVRDAARRLAIIAGLSPGHVLSRARYLREAGLLPQGGHGVNAPHIEAGGIAYLMFALAAERATDAAEVARKLASLQSKEIDAPHTLLGYVAVRLGQPELVESIRFDCQGRWALSHDNVNGHLFFGGDHQGIATVLSVDQRAFVRICVEILHK